MIASSCDCHVARSSMLVAVTAVYLSAEIYFLAFYMLLMKKGIGVLLLALATLPLI